MVRGSPARTTGEFDFPRRRSPIRPKRRRTGSGAFPCRRLRAHGAPHPSSGGGLSRHVGRGDPRPPVPDQRRRRRGTLPEAGIHDPGLPGLSCVGQGRQDGRIFLSRPRLPLPGRGRRARPDRPRKFWQKGCGSRRRGNLRAFDGGRGGGRRRRSPPASATRDCSTACSRRFRCRASGAGACGAASRKAAAFPPSSTDAAASALAQPGVLAALESADHAGAKALVEDLLAIAGIDAVGGRTAGEIADRFLEQAALRSGEPIDADKRKVLESYLAVSGDPDEAARRLRRLADDAEPRPRQGARRVRKAQRLHRGARRPDRGDRVQRRLRARFRLLHRLRLRGARSREARREARPRRRPLRRARPASRREARTSRPSAPRSRSTGCRTGARADGL